MAGPDRRVAAEGSASGGWTGPVVQVLATSTGGVGAHVRDLSRGLVDGGAAVTVCGPAATETRFRFGGVGAGFVAVEISAATQPSDARAVAALRRAVAAADPQIVHAHGLRAGLVATLAARSRCHRRPLVVTLHNAVLSRGLRGGASRLAERMVARGADVVLGASADLVARAVAVGARDARFVPVAAPALPPPGRSRAAVRAELGVGPDTPLVLSVGRLHPQKGYDVLVTAAARWRRRSPVPQVVIAGDGPSNASLSGRIAQTDAPVRLLGHRDDVPDLLAAADLAVVTSVWEARQLFAQEALRAGVPLVATSVGGLPELVGDAAVLVEPGDVDGVDRAVQAMLDDPDTRAAYSRRGVRRAADWPTSQQTLAGVTAVYAELAGGGGESG